MAAMNSRGETPLRKDKFLHDRRGEKCLKLGQINVRFKPTVKHLTICNGLDKIKDVIPV
jgi:hypothetical protein